jgi:hypothetical protein
MDNDLAGILAAVVAAVGAVVAIIEKQIVLALIAGSICLLALAVAVKAL